MVKLLLYLSVMNLMAVAQLKYVLHVDHSNFVETCLYCLAVWMYAHCLLPWLALLSMYLKNSMVTFIPKVAKLYLRARFVLRLAKCDFKTS